jgi:hypothetical protein
MLNKVNIAENVVFQKLPELFPTLNNFTSVLTMGFKLKCTKTIVLHGFNF